MPALRILLVGAVLLSLTIVIHAVGTTLWIRHLLGLEVRESRRRQMLLNYRELMSTGVVLLSLHSIEVVLWAATYMLLPGVTQLKDYREAIYFSLVTFTTLGYGDITLGPEWRVLSGIEAMNGVLLFGWSTAMIYSIVQRVWKTTSPST